MNREMLESAIFFGIQFLQRGPITLSLTIWKNTKKRRTATMLAPKSRLQCHETALTRAFKVRKLLFLIFFLIARAAYSDESGGKGCRPNSVGHSVSVCKLTHCA